MAEEDIGQSQDGGSKLETVYNNLSEVNAPRGDVAIDDEIEGIPIETLSQSMKTSPKMSDTQVVDKRLFPVLKETMIWLNNMMVGRVFPETFNPLRNIIVKHLLQEYDEISFAEAICITEVALTIAIDGEGRMDIIHLFSKLSEVGQEEKANKLA